MRRIIGFTIILAMIALGACGDDSDDSDGVAGGGDGEATEVSVTLSDFSIELGAVSAPAGEVTFAVHNKGPSVHEFVVFKTDLAIDELPTDDVGDVVENEEFEPLDEIEDIAPNASPELNLTLEAGNYVVLCNIPAHFRQGMVQSFTVS